MRKVFVLQVSVRHESVGGLAPGQRDHHVSKKKVKIQSNLLHQFRFQKCWKCRSECAYCCIMTHLLKPFSFRSVVAILAIGMGSMLAGQQGRGQGAAPPSPESQAGHPSGKLVIWGDIASFDQPATAPTHCILTSRFKRGQRLGFRMTAIDGGSGEVENTAVLMVHLKYAGQTIDIPMRWRGQGNFPAREYPRQPSEMWTGVWVVPPDAQPGTLSYTVTAMDRFGRMATFSPFINVVSQITIVE